MASDQYFLCFDIKEFCDKINIGGNSNNQPTRTLRTEHRKYWDYREKGNSTVESIEFVQILEKIKSLENKLETSLEQCRAAIKPKDRSQDLNELMGALAKAQQDMLIADKSSANPYFKSRYADLASVVEASRKSLAKNGLCVTQQITITDSGMRLLVTNLGHSSGQFISSRINITPAKDDMQSFGSCVTYLRRYAYASLVGVVAADEDDDGEVAMKPLRQQPTSAAAKFGAPDRSYDTVSKEELDMLQYELAAMPDLADNLLSRFNYASLSDIPKSKFRTIMDRILEIKRERDGIKTK